MIGAAEYEAREDFNRQKFMFQLSVYYSFSSDIRVHRGGRSLIAKSLCFNYQFTVLFETLPFPCNLSLHHLLFLVVCKINQKAKDGPKGFQVGGQGGLKGSILTNPLLLPFVLFPIMAMGSNLLLVIG